MTAKTSPSGTPYFPGLDGLRCVAVTLVICNHLSVPTPAWVHGYLGVDIFFVISGFLITSLLLDEFRACGRVSIAAFYIRRVFRIVPAFLLCVAAYYLTVTLRHDPVKAQQFHAALPYLLTFTREFAPPSAGNLLGHAWSLGVEEKFYAIWPLLFVWIVPLRKASVVILLGLSIATTLLPDLFARSYGGLMLGIWVAVAFAAIPDTCRRVAGTPLSGAIALAAVVICHQLLNISPAYTLLFSTAVAMLLTSVVTHEGWIRRTLDAAPMAYIGKRSYSIYLFHILVANAVTIYVLPRWKLEWWGEGALVLALTLPPASLVYRFVEKPMMQFGRRLASARRRRA